MKSAILPFYGKFSSGNALRILSLLLQLTLSHKKCGIVRFVTGKLKAERVHKLDVHGIYKKCIPSILENRSKVHGLISLYTRYFTKG